ncbi:MAG: flagellar export protein FliJ [Caulobacteraceae bacterium]|nr:flagellar export protein FliJ [Caulobacter sp.]
MSWTASLIRLSGYEVETLQKRLREIADRRARVAAALAELAREEEDELARGRADAEAGWYMIGFRQGCAERRKTLELEARGLELEAQGARDALTEAFEAQKKYEQVADRLRLSERAAANRRESAALDELALRRRA